MLAVEDLLWADDRIAGANFAGIGLAVGALTGAAARSTAATTYVAVAGRLLHHAALDVAAALAAGDLAAARTQLPALVGRDPADLDEPEIARAVVESVAENTVDAIVAPALWAAALGAPGALGYRAVNTLDAMVGHHSTRYERFGWASARLDDAAAWVPARVTAALVAAVRPRRAGTVWRTVRRDAAAHPSPNSGVAEAAFAAALGVRLGGTNRYGERVEHRPRLGDGRAARTGRHPRRGPAQPGRQPGLGCPPGRGRQCRPQGAACYRLMPMYVSAKPAAGTRDGARERVLGTAYELFCRHGTRAVGIDRVVAESGVAKMTLYRHFRSKDDLILAVLGRRNALWTEGWVQHEVTSRATDPADRLLVIFDIFDEWFHTESFEGCTFVNMLLEVTDRESPIHQASREHLRIIREFVRSLAADAGVRDPDGFAHQWHILMKGSIVAAGEGDVDAARRARAMGELLLARELAAVAPGD